MRHRVLRLILLGGATLVLLPFTFAVVVILARVGGLAWLLSRLDR